MTRPFKLGCVVVGIVIASAISAELFGTAAADLVQRAYFTLAGASIALWAFD